MGSFFHGGKGKEEVAGFVKRGTKTVDLPDVFQKFYKSNHKTLAKTGKRKKSVDPHTEFVRRRDRPIAGFSLVPGDP